VLVVLLAAAAACAAGIAVALTGYVVLALVLAGAAGAALFLVPPRALPLITLLVFFAIPSEYLPLPGAIRHLPLAALPLAVWAFRERRSGPVPLSIAALAGSLVVWTTVAELLSPMPTRSGMAWWIAFLITPCLVVLASPRLDVERFVSWLLGLATVTGLYGLVETFVLHKNPLYDALYSSASNPLTQVWESYRATTSLGHPLDNSTVFAVSAVVALDRSFTHREGKRLALFQVAVLLAAVAATKSRGAGVALAAGVVVVLARRWKASRPMRKALVLVVVAVGSIGLAAVIGARNKSVEGQSSSQQRSTLLRDTREAAAGHGVFGVGPGESEQFRTDQGLSTVSDAGLENAYAEMAVSIGVPGLLLFVAMVSVLILMGLRRPETVGLGAGLFVFAVSVGGYNALESHPAGLALLALLSQGIVVQARSRAPEPGLQVFRAREAVR
jgi:O-antigen ligase